MSLRTRNPRQSGPILNPFFFPTIVLKNEDIHFVYTAQKTCVCPNRIVRPATSEESHILRKEREKMQKGNRKNRC